jgi:hypothetical protein
MVVSLKEIHMSDLRAKLIRLAHQNPTLRPHLLPILAGEEGVSKVAGKDTADFVTWALKTQKPVPAARVIQFLERNGVECQETTETKRGQPIAVGELVLIQADKAPGDLQDLLQPFHLKRGTVVKVEGKDVVIEFPPGKQLLRVPGGTAAGAKSGVYRASPIEAPAGKREAHIEVVYVPAGEGKPSSLSIAMLKQYVEKGLAVGEERSPNYFSGYTSSYKNNKAGQPYVPLRTQQRGGQFRSLSPDKGTVYYIGLIGKRPGSWKNEFDKIDSE